MFRLDLKDCCTYVPPRGVGARGPGGQGARGPGGQGPGGQGARGPGVQGSRGQGGQGARGRGPGGRGARQGARPGLLQYHGIIPYPDCCSKNNKKNSGTGKKK